LYTLLKKKLSLFLGTAFFFFIIWILYTFWTVPDLVGWHCQDFCVFEQGDDTFMVLEAVVDEENKPIMGDEEYLIEGVSLPAEGWHISLYARDQPVVFQGKKQQISKNEVKKNAYGTWQVVLSPRRQEGVALFNTGKKEPVKLVLHLEEPEPYVIRWSHIFTSPSIKKKSINPRYQQ
jgi:hypothetical protein